MIAGKLGSSIQLRIHSLVPIESLPFHPDITAVFSRFADSEHAVLFDSGKPEQQQGRYDILSAWPQEYVTLQNGKICHSDTDKNNHLIPNLHGLKQLLSRRTNSTAYQLPFCSGWIGFASYELGYWLEKTIGSKHHTGSLPDFQAAYYAWAIVQDHEQQQAFLVYEDNIDSALLDKIHRQLTYTPPDKGFALTSAFGKNQTADEYRQNFSRIQHYISAGDCYQVNIAMQYQASFSGSPFSAYQQLRKTVPAPHMAYLNLGQTRILSISPERFIAAQGSHVETRPIKGTAARAADPQQDKIAANTLLQSSKNRAENVMIVDLLRNDLGRHCKAGSIKVDALFELETYRNVHHLVSSISGTIREDATVWDVFFDSFPGGSITGAPKIRAGQIINELENFPREIYCGSIFYASNHGHFDSSIAIRTLLCHENTITAWAGGGIVKDSTVDEEYQECENKIGHLLKALEAQS